MTATVNSTAALPVPSMEPNAPIVDDNSTKGGLTRLGRSINTAYEQSRTVLVNQPSDGLDTLISATSSIARYRVKTLGYSGGVVASETVEVWLLLSFQESGGGGGAATVTITQGSNTCVYVYSASDDTSNEWRQCGDLTVDDDAEYLDFEVEITAASNMDTTDVHTLAAYYKTARTSLVSGAYATNGAHPIHDEHLEAEDALSTHLLHHMHRNVLGIWEYRQGGNLVSCAFGPDNQVTTGIIKPFLIYVPRGVEEIQVWFYEMGSAGGTPAGGGGGSEWVSAALRTPDFAILDSDRVDYTLVSTAAWDGFKLTCSAPPGLDRTGQILILTVQANLMEFESVCVYSVNAVRA